jgi:drug/metabolite transporter (DMT)-like permease
VKDRAAAIVFVALCLAWGSTWLAIKIGVEGAPPLIFAGTRFLLAGAILLLVFRLRDGDASIARADWPTMVVMGLTVIGVTFGLIFWGEQHISSGVAGVLVQGVVPLGMFGFAVAYGHESPSRAKWAGIALGIVGIVILFMPNLGGPIDDDALLGMAAVTAGTVVYCWGSVSTRDVLQGYPTLLIAGLENVIGGVGLVCVSIVLEAGELADPTWLTDRDVWLSWVYLVIVGSLVGFTSYIFLLKRWGASRTSVYAFVTPILALVLGYGLYDENVGLAEIVGALVILCGVATIVLSARAQALPERLATPAETPGEVAEGRA